MKQEKMANTKVVLSGAIPDAGPVARAPPMPLNANNPTGAPTPLAAYEPRMVHRCSSTSRATTTIGRRCHSHSPSSGARHDLSSGPFFQSSQAIAKDLPDGALSVGASSSCWCCLAIADLIAYRATLACEQNWSMRHEGGA